MKINAVYLNNKNHKKFENINYEIITVFSVIILAIIIGAVCAVCSSDKIEIRELLNKFLTETSNEPFFKLLITKELQQLIFIAIIFVSGSSIYGKAPITLIVFYKILGISYLSGVLISTYLLEGLEYILLIFLPGKILYIFAIILVSVKCLKSSDALKNKENAEFDNVLFMKQNMFSSILIFISAFIDIMLLKVFLPLFSFA